MFNFLFKPFKIILMVYALPLLSIVANIAQLTNFNLLDFLKNYAPQSYYFIAIVTLLVYIILVIIEFKRNKATYHHKTPYHLFGQSIQTRNVKNSTIIQIKNDNGGKER